MGTHMRDLLVCGLPWEVLARRHIQSAWKALVIHIFWPLMIKSSPSLLAVVWMLATSDPAPGSLTPRHDTKSPVMLGLRNCSLTWSFPNLKR